MECVKPAARERKKAWYAKDPDRARADSTRYYEQNRAACMASAAAYKAARADWWRDYHRRWRMANPAKLVAWVQRRNAVKLQAIPSWADRGAIEAIYEAARRRTLETGVEHEVDHSVPLRSPLVCGLHVEHNLAILPATVNMAKGNRHWPDMP